MATTKKTPGSAKTSTKAGAKKTTAKAVAAKTAAAKNTAGAKAEVNKNVLTLGSLKPSKGSWPKRTRVGRGHGSGMVKTGGEGGKGQTVRSGGGKGPALEGGQTPSTRRLPQAKGVSQKARDIGHFGQTFAVINLAALTAWDPAVEISPQSLKAR